MKLIRAKELWHDKQESWLHDIELSTFPNESVLVESEYSFVSLGTERLLLSDDLNNEIASEMIVPYMQGDMRSKFTYGYSVVGKINSEDQNLNEKRVHFMHPHQNRAMVSLSDVTILPSDMNPKLGTLISNMETAVTAVWDAQIDIGDKILVMGYGSVGALVALIVRDIPGAELYVLETDVERREKAQTHGFQCVESSQLKGIGGFDVIFNVTANESALQQAIDATRVEGKIIELSWYGSRKVNVNLGAAFHYGRKQLICSQVSRIPSRKQSFWNYHSRKALVIKLLCSLNPIYLIDQTVDFLNAPTFFNELRRAKDNSIGTVIKY